jgi:DNA-binding NarL/FixJ family response regulator
MPQNTNNTQLSKRLPESASPAHESDAIKVFIVGDSHIMRSGLRKILESQAPICVLGEISARRANVDGIARQNPDLVLVDVDPRGTDPLKFIGAYHESLPGSPLLVLSDLADHELAQKAVALGAAGIVLKMQPPAVLIAAILELFSAHRDHSIPTTTVTAAMDETKRGTSRKLVKLSDVSENTLKVNTLTVREKEIIRLIGVGLKNKDIAKRLGISDITVRHHLTSIFCKLEVTDRQKLLILAHRCGLADLTLNGESA